MPQNTQWLFCQLDLRSVIDAQRKKMFQEIDKIDGNSLLNANVDDLCDYLEEKYRLNVPRLLEDKITADHSEKQIDVSKDPARVFFDHSGPFYVTGTAVSIHIPFEGDAALFRCQSSQCTLNPPRGTVQGNELRKRPTITE